MTYHIHTKHKQYLADVHTPVAIYNKLRDIYPGSLLFESADYHDRSDNKSFICLEPIAEFSAKRNAYQIQFPDELLEKGQATESREILSKLKHFVGSFKATASELPLNTQGIWGYSSFESVQYMEDIDLGSNREEVKDNPDLMYQFFRFIIIFDHFKKELFIVEHGVNSEPTDENGIDRIHSIIQSNNFTHFHFQTEGEVKSNLTDDEYRTMVSRGVAHCKRGDTFQVVLSRAFQQKYKGDDFTLYRCLRSVSPSPYLFYLDYGDFKIFGSSPESQLQVHGGVAAINPIAGTVKRGVNMEEDRQKADSLKNNPKEMSEHVMLVDLARNDLSKNNEAVEVETYAEVQYFAQVIHMVSKVSGKVDAAKTGLDIYSDTFPAGTLSGAPKYRAMQIIAENEKTTRNFYGGAVGFFGFDGSVNTAIIIRSVLVKNNTLVYQAGAGIVSDSTPEGELQEVFHKVRSIQMAIQKANEL